VSTVTFDFFDPETGGWLRYKTISIFVPPRPGNIDSIEKYGRTDRAMLLITAARKMELEI